MYFLSQASVPNIRKFHLKFVIRCILENVSVDAVTVVKFFKPVQNLSLQLFVLQLGILGLVDCFQSLGGVIETVQGVGFFENLDKFNFVVNPPLLKHIDKGEH